LPSIVCLFGSCLIFYAIAWRLAPQRRSLSGLLAVLLLLTAPNTISFFANGLVEASTFFLCYLALLAYIWFLEEPDSRSRAMLAGAAIAAAVLTKYDHGILLALAIGLSEALRARFHPLRLLRSTALPLFATAGVILGLWFAHPGKIAALLDASKYSFFGGPRMMVVSSLSTWFLEYSVDAVVGVLMIVSLFAAYPYRRRPGLRALWIFAVVGMSFLILRGRFRYRYNIVEAPAFLLLVSILLPVWIPAWSRRMRSWSRMSAMGITLAGVLGSACGLYWLAHPDSLFNGFASVFRWLYELGPRHLGLQREAEHYVRLLATLRGGIEDIQLTVLIVSAAALVVAVALLLRKPATPVLVVALLVTFIPGAVRLWIRAPRMVDWEIGGAPALHKVYAAVDRHLPRKVEILLGGAWNNLANNSLRWYLLTGYRPRDYDDIRVWGATIGSITLPPGPRVAYWAQQLGRASAAELPGAVVLIEPRDNFLQRVDFDMDAVVYRRVMAAREQYRLEAAYDLPETGCRVEVYRIIPGANAPAVPVGTELPPQIQIGEGGWLGSEDTWRNYWNPMIYPRVYETQPGRERTPE
jgi:hypothetical protein